MGGTKSVHPLKGRDVKSFAVLREDAKSFCHFVAPLPVINDGSLTGGHLFGQLVNTLLTLFVCVGDRVRFVDDHSNNPPITPLTSLTLQDMAPGHDKLMKGWVG